MANNNTNPSHYTQGYHSSVARSHTSQTAAKDAAFLLTHILSYHRTLDIDCGPRTITSGFCPYVPNGSVTGVDVSDAVLDQVRSLASSSLNL